MTRGPEIKGLIECALADDIDAALDKLGRAVSITDDQLRAEHLAHPRKYAHRSHPA